MEKHLNNSCAINLSADKMLILNDIIQRDQILACIAISINYKKIKKEKTTTF